MRFQSRLLGSLAAALTACVPGVGHAPPFHAAAPDHRATAPGGPIDRRHPQAADDPTAGDGASRPVARTLRGTATSSRPSVDGGSPSPAASAGVAWAGAIQTDAYGVNLDPLGTCVSCTSAQAGRDSSGAEGRGLRVAGEGASEGQIPANGYTNGALLPLPVVGPVEVALAPWGGSTTADGESSRAVSRCALVDLKLDDGRVGTATIVESRSEAGYSQSSSQARSQSDAARVTFQHRSFDLVLLHSDSSSDAPGHTYLASIDGVEVMRSGRGGDGPGIVLPGVTSVALLRSDQSGGLVASVSDGRAQRVLALGTTWVGSPPADPEPMR